MPVLSPSAARGLRGGCVDLSAHLTYEIAQSFERFARREATLNLRVVGSIPIRLTTSVKAGSGWYRRRAKPPIASESTAALK